jgi:hypothetical protein
MQSKRATTGSPHCLRHSIDVCARAAGKPTPAVEKSTGAVRAGARAARDDRAQTALDGIKRLLAGANAV